MTNNKNTTTTEEEIITQPEEDLTVTDELDYASLLNNCPYCFYYYDENMNKCHIDKTLEVLEDNDNIYVITIDEIITLIKTELTDESVVQEETNKKTQKQIDKFVKKMDKQIKKLNKQITKGVVKKKKK